MTQETITIALGHNGATLRPGVIFRRAREVPPNMVPQLDFAIKDFMATSHVPPGVEPKGFYEATLQAMANATYVGAGGCDMWIGTLGDELVSFVMATVVKEIDNRLTYWVSQAWVRKDQRRQRWVKEAWQKIRTRAKEAFCSHVVVVSSRNDKAYCRFLGPGWHRYAGLLKEDI